ncbi:crossover junction endodeoxyribonuclease RuvC [Candidatus Uhrbacteria bacterium]|nr:crossover junction endodeoxyribonuclease RuvC [Candidatus Uhrbacteria bacterium]
MSAIYLGIDPGIADTGYGVVAALPGGDRCLAYGSIRTPAGADPAARLLALARELNAVIAKYRPSQAALERVYFSKNVKTASIVTEARGVIRLCLAQTAVPCVEYNPSDVKLAVCSHGTAAKTQVQKMVMTLLGLKEIPKPDDAADALALALTIAHSRIMTRVAEDRL